MNRKGQLRVTSSFENWKVIRDCYVMSFHNYPLYEHMVPDASKREAFLRAYLDANYEVTVESGQGVLLGMWVPENVSNNNNGRGVQAFACNKLIGGVLMVPPSKKGRGWSIDNDEPYWRAYDKHNLAEISEEGLKRVKRYEAWENSFIAQKVSQTQIPMWNGLFCAILPEYTSKGLGSAVYKQGVEIVSQQWKKIKMLRSSGNLFSNSCEKSFHTVKPHVVSGFAEKVDFLTKKEKHTYSWLSGRQISSSQQPMQTMYHLDNEKSIPASVNNPSVEIPYSNTCCSPFVKTSTALPAFNPVIIAISHSERSANFHKSNNYETIKKMEYYNAEENMARVEVHLLALDPFLSDNIKNLKLAFSEV